MADYSIWARIEETGIDRFRVTVSAVALRSKVDSHIADMLTATCRSLEQARETRDRFVAELHRRIPSRGDAVLSVEGD